MSWILELFVNKLTGNDKCSLRNSEDVPQPIQMQLSKKQKIVSQLFLLLWD